jgi:O-antigen/teichoic acid export membrane protein
MLAALVTLRIMTSLMGPSQVATVSQFSSIAGLVFGLLAYPVVTYFVRHQLEWQSHNTLASHLGQLTRYIFILSAGTGLVAMGIQFLFPLVSGVSAPLTGLVVGLLTATLSFAAMGSLGLNVFARRWAYISFVNLGAWACPLIAAILFLAISPSPASWSLGIAFGQAIGALSFVFLLAPALRSRAETATRLNHRTIADFAGAQSIAFVLWWGLSQSYRFSLGSLGLTEVIGLVAAVQMITSQLMQAFTGVMSDFFMPRIMHREGATKASLGVFVEALLPAIIFFGITLVGVGPLLVLLFLGERFHGVSGFIGISALLDTFWGVYSVLCVVCIAQVDTRPTIRATLLGAALTILLVPVLAIWWQPLWGTLLAMGIGYAAMGVSSLITLARTLALPWRRSLAAVAMGVPVAAGGTIYAWHPLGLLPSLALLAVIGLYFAAGQYVLARRWLGARPAMVTNPAQAAIQSALISQDSQTKG